MKQMRKIFSVAGTTLRLLFRGGAAWGLLLLTSALAVFIFFSASSGDALIDELRLRVEYSLYASTTLLNLALIYFACVSLRKEIDERRFHTISAAPVPRGGIWLGKFLGILTLGVMSFIAISIAISLSCVLLIHRWEKPDQVKDLGAQFFRTHYQCKPDLTKLEKQVALEYPKHLQALKRKEEAKHHAAADSHEQKCDGAPGHDHSHCNEWEGGDWRERKTILAELRKNKQIIAPETTAKWKFNWTPNSNYGKSVLLRFKFYTNQKRKPSEGVWSILSKDGKTLWSEKFKGYPFIRHELTIPTEFMPKTDEFTLAYQATSSTFVIFPVYNDGLTILYDSGGVFKNFCYLFAFVLMHMAVLVALALMFSAMFSYSVAVFATTSLYIVASFSSFFNHVLTDLSFHEQTLSTKLFSFLIQAGLWLAEGAKALPVKYMFAQGVSIPFWELIKDNSASFALYLALVVFIGTWILTRKEIDKILQA